MGGIGDGYKNANDSNCDRIVKEEIKGHFLS